MKYIILILIILLVIYIFLIFPSLSRKDRMRAYSGTMFAHRGYHDLDSGIPENSLPAFKAAVKRGYGIEFDLHLTKDEKVIVFHDDTLARACRVKGSPSDYTYAQLKKARLFGTEEQIPLFTELLTVVNGRVPLLIEFKLPTKDTRLCELAYDILKDYDGPYIIESFNPCGLRWFAKNAPQVLRGQLSDNLVKSDTTQPKYRRLAAKYLLLNFYGRPDFISYKMADIKTLTNIILRGFFQVPYAVWTVKNNRQINYAKNHFEMVIFERHGKNY